MRDLTNVLRFGKSTPLLFLMIALALGVGFGMADSPVSLAQEESAQNFVVMAGADFASINTDVQAFLPRQVTVHRGDTVTWAFFGGFHNIRFADDGLLPPFLFPDVNDVEVAQMNPDVLLPSIENGATLNAMGANTGLFFPPGFSLVIDLEPGTYHYVCDLHPGMEGVIRVVDDATPIASPVDVIAQGSVEQDRFGEAAYDIVEAMNAKSTVATAVDGVAHIQVDIKGLNRHLSVQQFFPATAVIHVGERVTWTVPEGSAGAHTVTWPPKPGAELAQWLEQEDGQPILALTSGLLEVVPENGRVGQGDAFNSGLISAGESFTLTFTEPGGYPFFSSSHPAMHGTVVVLPAE